MVPSLQPCTAGADAFGAMPGMWRTTRAAQPAPAGSSAAPVTAWTCVYEDADPWTAFVPERPDASCTVQPKLRTATSLEWETSCSAGAVSHQQGLLRFDSALHYRGRLDETLAGQAAPGRRWQIEGWRRAACTSPAD